MRALRRSLPEVNELFIQKSQYLYEQSHKDVFHDLDSECSEEIDEEVLAAQKREEERIRQEAITLKCTEFDEISINSFDGVDNGYDEPTIIEEENPNEG